MQFYSGVSDVNEGKTLFLRNISFDSTQEDVEDAMKKFGEIVYARVYNLIILAVYD